MSNSRRGFLQGVGGAAAALALGAESAQAAAPNAKVPFSPTRSILELEGHVAGFVPSVAGGEASGILASFLDQNFVVRKQVANIDYAPIVLQAGPSLDASFFSWVKATLERNFQTRNGAIIAADLLNREQSRLEFYDALITEVSFPKLDASDKSAAYVTVALQPQRSESTPGSGGKVQVPLGSKKKLWQASNFRVEISGLDNATSRVSKVSALTVKRKTVGDERAPIPYLDLSNITLTIPASDAEPFQDWFKSFVIDGNNGQEAERQGTITLLAPDLQSELLTIELSQVGILSVAAAAPEGSRDTIQRVEIELYMEEMTVSGAALSD